ncbi:MAG: ribonuclease H [Bacteroidota bacterium]
MNLFAEVYTDGSCHTQQCIGAWASVILINDQKKILSGTEKDTTHNRMEVFAVINSIKYIRQHYPSVNSLKIVSDSQYVIGLAERETKFIAKDFLTNGGKDIRNADLVKELLQLLSVIKVEFVKIKAHQKATEQVNYNIEVDKLSRQLVRQTIKAQ